MSKRAIVIGAGIGGLATSVRLAHKGYTVEVFEANAYPGGKLSAFEDQGYRFDAGPSLFTMPQFVDALFELVGENPRDHFNYKKKEIACQYFWPDSIRLTAYGDPEKFAAEVETKLQVPQDRLKKYFKRAQRKYDRTAPLFLEKSLHKKSTLLSKDTLKALANLHRYDLLYSLHHTNQKQLKEPHLVQFFDRFATYNGSDPYQTSGMMTLVQHLEQAYGTFIPEGGMVQITEAVYQLARRMGIKFNFNSAVQAIQTEGNRATGVQTATAFFPADLVISNMDIFPTYKRLLPELKAPENILKQERSSSAVIFYWGVERNFPELDLHNILFSEDYKQEFHQIFKERSLAEDPTVYINISSKDVPEDAPEGGENWFVMINTPADHGQDWDQLVAQLRKRVLAKVEQILGVDIASLIRTETVLTPPLIQQKTQSYLGALYGASSNNAMAAFLRHPNFSRQLKNLYFCGGSVHPGGGIPLCLLSAKITADLIP